MKAIVCRQYGSPEVLQLVEMKKPEPGPNEVLIKIHVASVTRADGMMRMGTPLFGRIFMGLMRPRFPVTGTGFAGKIEAVGGDVTLFEKGASVFGESIFGFGTNAEYVCVPEDGVLVTKPDSISHEEAAPLCDGALTSLSFLKDMGHIQRGQRVLINGASGSLGSSAVQIARHFGAEVTGVCSGDNAGMVKSLGASKVIDYTREDFTQSGESYDIIFDTLGKRSFSQCKGVLKNNGIYLCPVLGHSLLLQMLWTMRSNGKKAIFSATGLRPCSELRQLLDELRTLVAVGALSMVIDRRYSLQQTAEAHRYVEKGHKKGNVILRI